MTAIRAMPATTTAVSVSMPPLAALDGAGVRVWPWMPRAGGRGQRCSRCGGGVAFQRAKKASPAAFVCAEGCSSAAADFVADHCADPRLRIQARCPECKGRHELFVGEQGTVSAVTPDMGLVLYSESTRRARCVLGASDTSIEARMGWRCPVVPDPVWNGGWWLDARAPRRCSPCLAPPAARARRLARIAAARWRRRARHVTLTSQ